MLTQEQGTECRLLQNALTGETAHVKFNRAIEGLRLDVTGKKVLNAPYTIWQLLKHIDYWQQKFLQRLRGEQPETLNCTWIEGWEERQNAHSQEELEAVISRIEQSIQEAITIMHDPGPDRTITDGTYHSKFDVIQCMASHVSYHLGEIVLLRRIFGQWKRPVTNTFFGSFS